MAFSLGERKEDERKTIDSGPGGLLMIGTASFVCLCGWLLFFGISILVAYSLRNYLFLSFASTVGKRRQLLLESGAVPPELD